MKKILSLTGLLMTAGYSFGLTVVDTQLPTYPTAQYMNQMTNVEAQVQQTIAKIAQNPNETAAQVVSGLPPVNTAQATQNALAPIFPFQAQGMTVGTVTTQNVNFKQLTTPIFLMGSDPTSIAWLQKYKDRLIALGAQGFLIQASSMDDVSNVKSIAGNLPVSMLPNSSIGQSFGVSHYPVLISNHLIEQ